MSGKRRAESLQEPELPITPMLDLSFQILFFFVMIYHPSALEVQLDLNLPQGGRPPVVFEPAPVLNSLAEVTVVVRTQRGGKDGGVSQIVVQSPNAEKAVTLSELGDELQQLRGKVDDARDIKIQADSKLKWACVVKVMDVCHASVFKDIHFNSPSDEGR